MRNQNYFVGTWLIFLKRHLITDQKSFHTINTSVISKTSTHSKSCKSSIQHHSHFCKIIYFVSSIVHSRGIWNHNTTRHWLWGIYADKVKVVFEIGSEEALFAAVRAFFGHARTEADVAKLRRELRLCALRNGSAHPGRRVAGAHEWGGEMFGKGVGHCWGVEFSRQHRFNPTK